MKPSARKYCPSQTPEAPVLGVVLRSIFPMNQKGKQGGGGIKASVGNSDSSLGRGELVQVRAGKCHPWTQPSRCQEELGCPVSRERGQDRGARGGGGLCWRSRWPRWAPARAVLGVCPVTCCRRNVNVSQQINSAPKKLC